MSGEKPAARARPAWAALSLGSHEALRVMVAGLSGRETCRIDAKIEALNLPYDEELSDERINQVAREPFRGFLQRGEVRHLV